ncbi:MAG: helix-turn-helix domain-containing protein [Ignavibacteriales bacterium]|nr:helix-turn-helix domain-containing protein [Ignavibacteriales bacterium]
MTDSLPKIIRFHRKRSRLTQLQLAVLAGVGKTVVFDIERGKKTVQLDSLLKIMKVLNISVQLESPLMKYFHNQNPVDGPADEKS